MAPTNDELAQIQRVSTIPDLLLYDPDPEEGTISAPVDYDSETHNITSCKYLTAEEFNLIPCSNISAQNPKFLSLIHINVRSLNSKFTSLELLLSNINEKFDIIAISETWFSSDTPHSLFNLDGYSLHYASRKNKQGGGVALYISNLLSFHSAKVYCSENIFESIFIEVSVGESRNVLVSCIYRTPGSCINSFCDELRPLLQNVIKPRHSIFLCGDYNINLLKYEEHPPTREFIDLMSSYGLKPAVNKPTRITRDTQTLIDNIFTNEIIKPIEAGILINDISDHLPIYAVIKHGDNPSHLDTAKNQTLKRRKLDSEALLCLQNSLRNTDWGPVINPSVSDVNIAYNTFLEKFLDAYNRACPIQNIKLKKKSIQKPWMTDGLKHACKKKNRLFKRYLCIKNDLSEQEYKNYKNVLTTTLRAAEKDYYEGLLQRHIGDMKNTWKAINTIIGKGKMCDSLPTEFIENGINITSAKEICNGLNKFFTEIGPKLAENIESIDESPLNYIRDINQHSMLITPVSEYEVENIVKSCKRKNSKDYHDISMSTIQKVFSSIKIPMTHICNLSLETGIFPEKMKIAKVIPLYKSGIKNVFNNYRPVSLLPQFSKILEKIFNSRLDTFLERCDILNEAQFGFRAKYNTTHALMKLMTGISDSIDQKKSTIGIFIDLKKAFDTVNHKILREKLDKYGIRGVANSWIKSYLDNRKQFVCVKDCNSELLNISCGVPQGSILGPKLFILYINDMCNVTKIFEYVLFADDTNLFCSNDNMKVLIKEINEGLSKLKKWFAVNKLSLSIEKTNFINFSKGKNNIDKDINIRIGNENVKRVDSTKFLGIIIQENLSWKMHIDKICSKMMKAIGIMNRMKSFLPQNSLRMLYNTLVVPHMTYSCEVWGSTYPSNLTKIVLIQKKALRIINDLNFLDHCEHLFDRKCMKFQKLTKLKIAIFMYKVKMKILPPPIQKLFTSNNQQMNTRQNIDFVLKYARTTNKLHSLSYSGVRTWNDIPQTIRNSASISTFKKLLIKHMCNAP